MPGTTSVAQQPTNQLQPRVDFVIVTALEEERDAVLNKLPDPQRLAPSEEDVRVYYQSDLPVTFPNGARGTYRIVVMPLLGMGRLQAATATSDAIRKWRPRYVILVGIAGGVAEKGVKLGDILISTQIVDYELQKLTPNGPQIRWEVHRADPRLLGAARNLDNETWSKFVRTSRPGPGQPKRHTGPIASGDKVIAFGEVMKKHRSVWPAIIGVEMEAAGVATAAFQAAEPPGFFMIRGVCDLADEDKGTPSVEKWRTYACDVAASYAVGMLKSGPITPREPCGKPEQNLDTRILQALYDHYLRQPGNPQMNLNELIAVCEAERDEVIECLWGLQGKNWTEHNLTERADMGIAWLTILGIGVAKDVSRNKAGRRNP
jgi:nucleoside phosphorylase